MGHRTTTLAPLTIRGHPIIQVEAEDRSIGPDPPDDLLQLLRALDRLESDDEPSPAGIQVDQRREAMAIDDRPHPARRSNPSAMKRS